MSQSLNMLQVILLRLDTVHLSDELKGKGAYAKENLVQDLKIVQGYASKKRKLRPKS